MSPAFAHRIAIGFDVFGKLQQTDFYMFVYTEKYTESHNEHSTHKLIIQNTPTTPNNIFTNAIVLQTIRLQKLDIHLNQRFPLMFMARLGRAYNSSIYIYIYIHGLSRMGLPPLFPPIHKQNKK